MSPEQKKIDVIRSDQSLVILDELGVGAFTVDLGRKVKSMNLTAQALMGLKENDVKEKDCRDIFTGVPCMTTCLLKGDSNAVTDEPDVDIINENETARLLTRMAIPIYDAGYQLAGCLTILQDHSPIADLIDRLHYEERSLKIILDNLDVGIFTVNRGGYITFFNHKAEKISGYDRRQVVGKSCSAIFGKGETHDLFLSKESIQKGLKQATYVPLRTMEACVSVLELTPTVIAKGNINAASDGGAGMLAAHAGMMTAALNVRINLNAIKDQLFVAESETLMNELIAQGDAARQDAWLVTSKRLGM